MGDRLRIFSHDGIALAQIRTSAERSWTLVTETSAQFSVSVFDEKCNPHILNYGNWVLIENSDGLIIWVGMIDDIYFDSGAAIITAFTPERLFFYRRGPLSQLLTGSAADIFALMVNYVNGLELTPLAAGNLSSNSGPMQETLNPNVLSDNLARIVSRSGECYRWRPVVIKGNLVIYCDWYPSEVMETGLVFWDGHNITGDYTIQETPPINDVLAFGDGSDWTTRALSFVTDDESKAEYGLRQASISVSTVSQPTLDLSAKTLLQNGKQPQSVFPISALNVEDTFQRLVPGAHAIITVLVGMGFSRNGTGYRSADVIVQSMDYNPSTGVVALSV